MIFPPVYPGDRPIPSKAGWVSLVAKPKVGREQVFDMVIDVEVGGQTASERQVQRETVESVKENVFTIRTVVQPEGGEERNFTRSYDLDGTLKTPGGGEEIGGIEVLNQILIPDFPVRPGGVWVYDYDEEGRPGMGYRLEFRYAGEETVENVPCVKFIQKAKLGDAKGVTIDGTVWLDKADLSRVKVLARIENVPVTTPDPSNPMTAVLKISLTRRG